MRLTKSKGYLESDYHFFLYRGGQEYETSAFDSAEGLEMAIALTASTWPLVRMLGAETMRENNHHPVRLPAGMPRYLEGRDMLLTCGGRRCSRSPARSTWVLGKRLDRGE